VARVYGGPGVNRCYANSPKRLSLSAAVTRTGTVEAVSESSSCH